MSECAEPKRSNPKVCGGAAEREFMAERSRAVIVCWILPEAIPRIDHRGFQPAQVELPILLVVPGHPAAIGWRTTTERARMLSSVMARDQPAEGMATGRSAAGIVE